MLLTLLILATLILAAFAHSQWQAHRIATRFPNSGEMVDVGGFQMNCVHIRPDGTADLPPIVFIHGAGGNLLDQLHAFQPALDGRAEMLFVDRPGHGYSERGGPANARPDGQADAIARLMDKRGISRAIIVGHSFGAAIVASLALRHPERTEGVVLLAPATHPWPGGVDWHITLATLPLVGWLFANTAVIPLGLRRIDRVTQTIFWPNPRPKDYVANTAPHLVLRPATFLNNAVDVANLHAYVTQVAPRYAEISAPTVIITGDQDEIVLADIHSRGLASSIVGSELLWIGNLGHKPDYVVTDLVVAAIEKISGKPRDLQKIARRAEARLTIKGPTTDLPYTPVRPSEPI
ncbi:esterase [Sinorhizobium fredii USDA 205]|uniref:Alpha/beta fold hydrolase n=1 Tax=Rhizobium fredii TaxID=380 RepID=A0A844AC19_RHIFR|nr:alpha/beta hydrolase [Sinorhizobium fredii]AWM26426.1 putative esterase [Sinorhizobium fredii CCBAU 25509]KSV89145.1 esterase [Sinorhizobium fredii USDA 205]MQW95264.1 alpha/beta fold hydrolase [Sinorhizobium fredii]MQX09851.1 alpha/beta fold hydrolase [Sinorhizobium fredii]UTY50563.1 alpha/beta hydrolase [Sinorhizobium fredii]